MKIHEVTCNVNRGPWDGSVKACNCRAQYDFRGRLDTEELRVWLDRKPPPKPEPEATELETAIVDVHEPGCNCADCSGDSF